MDLDRFRGEVTENPPTGIDLDESGELVQLDLISRWSDTENEPDWPALRDAAADALDRSRDVRAVVYLAAALLQTEGVRAFCGALGLLRHYIEAFWDQTYPLLDGDDAIERSSAVFNLVNYHRVIRPLRQAPLVADRAAGRFSFQDIEIARGRVDPPPEAEGDPPTENLVLAAFQAMDGEELRGLDASLGEAVADLDAVEGVFREHAGAAAAPDLNRLRGTLADMRAFTAARLNERGEGEESAAQVEAGAQETTNTTAPAPAAAPGTIQSRQDAVRALDAVIRYFRTHEPSSPVPLLLERAKRLVDMDFMGILEDIAPDAVNQARTISGKAGQE